MQVRQVVRFVFELPAADKLRQMLVIGWPIKSSFPPGVDWIQECRRKRYVFMALLVCIVRE